MRRFCWILALLLALSVPAMAASGASLVQSGSVISAEGSCQVNMTISLQLDSAPGELTFPIPAQAENILLNGSQVKTRYEDDAAHLVLPSAIAGSYTFLISYKLPMVVQVQGEKLYVQLPLLSGFRLPIETMELTVTLPQEVTSRPSFISGYHQEGIETTLVTTTLGNTISTVTTQSLKDHETLTLLLEVPAEMFPTVNLQEPLLGGWEAAALVCALLAVLYYCVCLLPVTPRRVRCFTAPEGISAGEVGSCLTGSGADLTLMVFSWAQLGYIRMEVDRKKQVRLYKRMEMGNERSEFECRVFRSLFKDRPVVIGSSYHYARTCRNVAAKSPLLPQLFKKTSGNPRIFRILALLSGAAFGVDLAVGLEVHVGMMTLLGMLLAGLCGGMSYLIQAGGRSIPLRDKTPLYVSLGCCGAWLVLGLVLGSLWQTAAMVAFQLLCGVGAAYGGQRSERGKRCLAELQSLRRFMTRTPGAELQRMLQANPNYFYELAPYALAMGVDRAFARRFGKEPLPDQGFLVEDTYRPMNAAQTAALMRQACDSLNALQKRLPYERLRGK